MNSRMSINLSGDIVILNIQDLDMYLRGFLMEKELHAKLSRFMYRKTREEVFTDLPEESHEFVQVEIDMKAYEADLNDFKKWYAKHKDISDEELEEAIKFCISWV